MKDAWNAIVNEVRRKESLVKSMYGANSHQYAMFFPKGLTYFHKANQGDKLPLIDALIKCFQEKATEFPGAADSLTSLRTNYLSASSSQALKKGDVKGSRSQRELARLSLANNLHELWLSAAAMNKGKPEVVKLLFNVSIFNKGTDKTRDGLGRLCLQIHDSDQKPIQQALIHIYSDNGPLVEKGMTDENGYYESKDLPIGFYTIKASQPGFNTLEESFQVFDHQDPLHELKWDRIS
jgi:hypothetical protein